MKRGPRWAKLGWLAALVLIPWCLTAQDPEPVAATLAPWVNRSPVVRIRVQGSITTGRGAGIGALVPGWQETYPPAGAAP